VSIERDLKAMSAEMRRMAKAAPKAVVDEVGKQALRLVLTGFDRAKAPSGVRWAPLREGTGKPLEGSGQLRGSIKLYPNARSFKITSDSPHGSYHQDGTEHIPARPFLPEERLSPTFERVLETAAEKALDRLSK
jgi:phage gpG-like protein